MILTFSDLGLTIKSTKVQIKRPAILKRCPTQRTKFQTFTGRFFKAKAQFQNVDRYIRIKFLSLTWNLTFLSDLGIIQDQIQFVRNSNCCFPFMVSNSNQINNPKPSPFVWNPSTQNHSNSRELTHSGTACRIRTSPKNLWKSNRLHF